VQGLGGVQEVAGRAGAGQRGADLARDDAGLAHAAGHDAALAGGQHAHGAHEVGVQRLAQQPQRLRLGAQQRARAVEDVVVAGQAGALRLGRQRGAGSPGQR
jgi:hypothetical protein